LGLARPKARQGPRKWAVGSKNLFKITHL
jgi:hypothetical protein